jgi:NIMA (never in mitosis gene a)-related kinase
MSRLSDFKIVGPLGKGSFGTVFKVTRIVDGGTYVMKQINITDMGRSEQQAAVAEVHLLASLDCALVTRYYDSFVDHGLLCIVMELCDRGDLQRLIKKQAASGKLLAEKLIWTLLLQVVAGVGYLHSKRILHRRVHRWPPCPVVRPALSNAPPHSHRDLKSANIFMCSGEVPTVKIGDLGVARVLGTASYFAKTCVGASGATAH